MNPRQSIWILTLFALTALSLASPAQELSDSVDIVRHQEEFSSARVERGQRSREPGLVVKFRGTEDLHYYALEKTAPAPGLQLKVGAQSDQLTFGPAQFHEVEYLNDSTGKRIEVYAGDFEVFLPITAGLEEGKAATAVVTIQGIACTSQLCLPPFKKTIDVSVGPEGQPMQAVESAAARPQAAEMQSQTTGPDLQGNRPLAETLSGWKETVGGEPAQTRTVPFYFLLAVLAGLSINIMPCVLPVLPLIVMRLVSQAKESGPRRLALGLAFCGGIVLFFAVFALISAIIAISTGTAIDLNSIYRNPPAVITLFLLIVFFALVFLDVLTIALPSSVSGHQSRPGFGGSVGMGFFAGVLSIPCSGALIGAVLVWAQTQPLVVSSAALVLMGVGMALPYGVLVSVPRLMDYLPKPGGWMEIFKKTGGFLLLLIAAKFTLAALPKERLINVLLYGVIFSFCVWMWGQWVGYSAPAGRKWAVRALAVLIAVAAGFWLLPAPEEPKVDWQPYEADAIAQALAEDRPVVIKFTADWCTNCKVVESRVYRDPAIARLIEERGFLPVMADTTQADFPAAADLNTVFGEAGNVPVTVILDPARQTMIKLRGIFSPQEFKETVHTVQ